MPYNEMLANRVADKLMHLPDVEEKEMFGGLVFMVDQKMCIGVMRDKMMLRLAPESLVTLENIDGWEPMVMSNTVMKGYILVSQDVLNRKEDLDFWINLALAFNPLAKASKKKKK
ncbi:TfoX/Sxy family protein [Pedobacter agri]|uniref:TfoX/Sxy family protein n=1 Tax=Pedobacter agri TaxID=454586 RepID=UPI002930A87A|nr:TfoX/Sxy family protein [Pedobacter agri]